jgi:hypothetical protein
MNQARSLSRLASTAASSRVLNLHEVEASSGKTQEHMRSPLFLCRRMNQAIILKHALRAHDRAYVHTRRATATKVIFPISRADLRLGGYSFFVEQGDLVRVFNEAIGNEAPQPHIAQDLELLREIARLPSLDPYLLRDATRLLGREVADCYFNISESDIRAVQEFLLHDMQALVARAFANGNANTSLLASRLSQMMLDDPTNAALDPLRHALKFDALDFEIALKGWKGVLYYKWSHQRLRQDFPDIARQLASLRMSKATDEDKVYLFGLIKRILAHLEDNFATVKKHIDGYDLAFSALVNNNQPKPFQAFLDQASQSFNEIGRAIGEISHASDFWSYRRAVDASGRIDVETAHEIIGELAHALGLQYDAELDV